MGIRSVIRKVSEFIMNLFVLFGSFFNIEKNIKLCLRWVREHETFLNVSEVMFQAKMMLGYNLVWVVYAMFLYTQSLFHFYHFNFQQKQRCPIRKSSKLYYNAYPTSVFLLGSGFVCHYCSVFVILNYFIIYPSFLKCIRPMNSTSFPKYQPGHKV